jgi:hypothetical protein
MWNYVELRGMTGRKIPAIPGISGIFRDKKILELEG